VWIQAVARTEGSAFGMLKSPPDVEEFLSNEGASRGVLRSQLYFYDMVQKDEHLLRMSEHDICLDTTTVNGMTTSLDVLYGALPLISTIGERMNSRFAAAVVTELGFPELAAPSLKEMEDIAVAFAN
jgi:protein O-GlcNAc transferase